MLREAVEWALAGFREEAEGLMVDEIVVDRVTGSVTDPMTGKDTPVYDRVYEGIAKFQDYNNTDRGSVPVVEHSSIIYPSRVDIPVGSYKPAVGDVVTVATSAYPMLVGLQFRATTTGPIKTFATAYRVPIDFKAE